MPNIYSAALLQLQQLWFSVEMRMSHMLHVISYLVKSPLHSLKLSCFQVSLFMNVEQWRWIRGT